MNAERTPVYQAPSLACKLREPRRNLMDKRRDHKRLIESNVWTDTGFLDVPSRIVAGPPRPSVMDYLWAQIEWHELGEPKGQIEKVISALRQRPNSFWVRTVAMISAGLAKHGMASVQEDLVETFSTTVTGKRVRDFMERSSDEDGNRALFTPKPLIGLAKLALAHAPAEAPVENAADHADLFLQTYLKLCDVIEAARMSEREEDSVRNLLRFWVQEEEYGAAGGFGPPIARMDVLLRQIPSELGESPSPSDFFEEVSGMPLGRFATLAMSVLAYAAAMDTGDPRSIDQHLHFDAAELVDKTHATEEEVAWVLNKLTLTEEDFQDFRDGDPTEALYYTDYQALRLRPLWKMKRGPGEARYVPISLPFLTWRISDGLYWNVLDAIRGKEGSRSDVANQFMTDFGVYLEAFARRLFERAMPPSPVLAKRFYHSVQASPNDPELDLVFVYPNAFVVVEIKSARYHYLNSVVEGDLSYIENTDLKKMLHRPAEQLNKGVEHLRSGGVQPGGRRYDGEAVFPVLVTYGTPPVMWPVWPRLQKQFKDKGLFAGRNVRPLAALDVGELEVLAALAGQGHALPRVLGGYVGGEYSDAPFRNYARAEYGDDADVGSLMKPEYEAVMQEAERVFKEEHHRSS